MVARRELFSNRVPDVPGGGTVRYVSTAEHDYHPEIEHREEAGTPAIVESIRAGLVFQLKEAVGPQVIEAKESDFVRRAIARWEQHPNINVLGSHQADRLSIVSFVIRHGDRFLHHNYVVALLNDVFGIQSRGGCSCAGPYGHRLLGIDLERSHEFQREINRGCEGIKPGWVRVNFNYFIDDATFDYLVDAVTMIASHGASLLGEYDFEPDSGLWHHRRGTRGPSMSLDEITYGGGRMEFENRRHSEPVDLARHLEFAHQLFHGAGEHHDHAGTGAAHEPRLRSLALVPVRDRRHCAESSTDTGSSRNRHIGLGSTAMLGTGRLRADRARRTVALVVLAASVAVGSSTVPLTVANAQDPAAVQAAQEIQAARDRADAAAQAMFDAESRLDTLEVEIADAERELAAVEAQADSMRTSLQQDAQRSFVNSGTSIPLLIDLDQANAGITADRQASVARGAASVELDDFDAVMQEVTAQQADLERQREATTQAREQYENLQAAAEAEVVKLAEIERQRLADVAVQRELERQRQAKLAQEAAAARQAQLANNSGCRRWRAPLPRRPLPPAHHLVHPRRAARRTTPPRALVRPHRLQHPRRPRLRRPVPPAHRRRTPVASCARWRVRVHSPTPGARLAPAGAATKAST